MEDMFEEIYKIHFREIYAYVSRVARDGQAAEDIVQDVFCAALSLGDQFRNHPNRKGWLMLTARNKCCELHRKMRRWAAQPLEEGQEWEAVDSRYGEIELEMTALGVLTREEWKLVKDYYLGGATIRELAKRCGKTENGMRVYLHRLKGKVRKAAE